ncbi:hypothetical protein HD554DRAFT_2263491 [Boletus coccyginus]|nr:hypothetical protein HD554DRAFT_2263491 [Boletus coccyginus]
MGKTYSCDVDGCDMVFSRDFQLRKHRVEHEDSNKLHYCKWPECDFYTLDSRRLKVHFATHTGEKIHNCPDKTQVLGPSGTLEREEACKYTTNDPSMLTKHRVRAHGYIPHPRARSKKTEALEFVFYEATSALTATSDATSHPKKAKRARKQKATVQRSESTQVRAGDTTLDDSLPSTSQEGVSEYEQRNVVSPNATGAGSQAVGFTNSAFEYMAASNPQAHTELLDTDGSKKPTPAPVAPITWAADEPSADVESQYAISPDAGDTTPVGPLQGDFPFDPAINPHLSTFFVEGFASPSTAGTNDPASYNLDPYNFARNSEMNTASAMDSFEGLGWDSLGDLFRL